MPFIIHMWCKDIECQLDSLEKGKDLTGIGQDNANWGNYLDLYIMALVITIDSKIY